MAYIVHHLLGKAGNGRNSYVFVLVNFEHFAMHHTHMLYNLLDSRSLPVLVIGVTQTIVRKHPCAHTLTHTK